VVSDRIKELEQKVKNDSFRQQEDRMSLETKISKGLQSRADLEQELELIMKTKEELEISY